MDIEISRHHDPNFLKFEKLNTIFLSKGYWPINYEYESFKIPPILSTIFDQYSTKYSLTKAMRRLIWHHSLGWVDLELEFENGKFNFKCLPTHAILVSYFDERSKSFNKLHLRSRKLNRSKFGFSSKWSWNVC